MKARWCQGYSPIDETFKRSICVVGECFNVMYFLLKTLESYTRNDSKLVNVWHSITPPHFYNNFLYDPLMITFLARGFLRDEKYLPQLLTHPF